MFLANKTCIQNYNKHDKYALGKCYEKVANGIVYNPLFHLAFSCENIRNIIIESYIIKTENINKPKVLQQITRMKKFLLTSNLHLLIKRNV